MTFDGSLSNRLRKKKNTPNTLATAQQWFLPGQMLLIKFSLIAQVFAVDWSPDGQRVASGGKDKCLRM